MNEFDDLPGGLPAALEAILMVTDEPIPAVQLATLVERPVDEVEKALLKLRAEYDGYNGEVPEFAPRGFELRSVGGGWRIYSRAEFAPYVSRYVMEGQTARLTQAALETLAVVAYRQPVSRAKISAIRGVNVDGVVKTLTQRGLIEEAGTDEATGAFLYQTTGLFLEKLGIANLEELPELSPLLPGLDQLQDLEPQEGGF